MALNAKKALAASKSYTDEVVIGGGAIKGKNCTVSSITDIPATSEKPAGQRVTFSWTLDDGTEQTGTMDVYNGEDGQDGQGIDRMYVNAEGHLVVVYDNGTEEDVGEITIPDFQADWNETDPSENSYIKNKPSIPAAQVNSDWNASSGVAEIFNKPSIPTKVSDLQNDSGFEANTIESISVNGTAVTPDANKNVNIVVQGGGGTSDYSDLTNKPSINNVTLSGNKTASDLGLATSNDLNTHTATKGDSGVQGHVSLYQGDVSNKTYAQGEAAASAHTHDTRYAPYSVVADISGKADKAQNATNGHLAGLDGGGNLKDSGLVAGNVLTKSNTVGFVKNDGTIDTNSYEKTGVAETLVKDTVGWSGKNLIPMTVEGIKALNTIGTWSGNTLTLGNLTFEILTDNEDNVTGIEVNGTDSNVTIFTISQFTAKAGTYEFNGTPSGGGSHTYYQEINAPAPGPDATDEGSGANYILTTDMVITVSITVDSGVTMSDVVFCPMLRHAGTDAAFEPYHATVDGLLGGKADKVANATNGNFAGLDANGNLTDSGKKASDLDDKCDLTNIAKVFTTSDTFSVGDWVFYEGRLYKCTTLHQGAWNSSHFSANRIDQLIPDDMLSLYGRRSSISMSNTSPGKSSISAGGYSFSAFEFDTEYTVSGNEYALYNGLRYIDFDVIMGNDVYRNYKYYDASPYEAEYQSDNTPSYPFFFVVIDPEGYPFAIKMYDINLAAGTFKMKISYLNGYYRGAGEIYLAINSFERT